MDPVNLAYYGVICGLLSLAAPRVRRAPARFALGILVGLVAVALLPGVRGALALG